MPYRTGELQGRGEGRGGIGCRQSNIGVGPRKLREKRLGIALTSQIREQMLHGGKPSLMKYIAIRATRGAEKGEAWHWVWARMLSGRYTSMGYAIHRTGFYGCLPYPLVSQYPGTSYPCM